MDDSTHMEMAFDDHNGCSGSEDNRASDGSQVEKPVKVRKKPGRKPNPASPAVRKAQNRAAQRAFRERKERHMREMETTIKQMRAQRDRFHMENEQLKSENEILKSENWYLKGIVLSLQLVCFQHNLAIPKHAPHINEQSLTVMAQSIPKHILSYLDCNAKSKAPNASKLHSYSNHPKPQHDRYVSKSTIVVTENGVLPLPHNSPMTTSSWGTNDLSLYNQHDPATANQISLSNLPDLTSEMDYEHESTSNQAHDPFSTDDTPKMPQPVLLTKDQATSNIAAFQALRLRMRLQAACAREKAIPYAIQPTPLQIAIPHDPRIDLIPTPHMRDRMILFRDQFNLDDCFQCLLTESRFHGGDPGNAANWELPSEFFEKYWFLTIDYTLRRTTNHWRKLQGLKEIDPPPPIPTGTTAQQQQQPTLEPVNAPVFLDDDLASFLGINLGKPSDPPPIVYPRAEPPTSILTSGHPVLSQQPPPLLPSQDSSIFSNAPIRLTNGYMRMPYGVPQMPPSHSRIRHNIP